MTERPAALDYIHAVVFLTRAKGFVQRKQFESALEALAETLRLDPQSGEALMIRATVRVEMGDYQQALADVERRLQIEPPDPMALLARGSLRAYLGELEPALADYTEFLRHQPETAHALRGRARTYARLFRFDEALADLDEALRLEPTNAEVCLDRGCTYQRKGCYAAAVADYQRALELGPAEAHVYNQFAWLLAACPQAEYRDGPRAVELARRGCELTNWQDANLLDTLASAYAECGQFDEAVTWATKALELADAEIKETVAGHVESFRDGRPARFEA